MKIYKIIREKKDVKDEHRRPFTYSLNWGSLKKAIRKVCEVIIVVDYRGTFFKVIVKESLLG